jgi:transposase
MSFQTGKLDRTVWHESNPPEQPDHNENKLYGTDLESNVLENINEINELYPVTPRLLLINLRINNNLSTVLIDTGASCSLINPSLVDEASDTNPVRVKGITGIGMLDKISEIRIELGNQIISHHAYVYPNLRKDCILGNDFLLQYKPVICYSSKTITIDGHVFPFFDYDKDIDASIARNNIEVYSTLPFPMHTFSHPIKVIVQDTIYLNPLQYCEIPVEVEVSLLESKGNYLYTPSESFTIRNSVLSPELYLQLSELEDLVVLNCNHFSKRINKGTCLGYLHPISSESVYYIDDEIKQDMVYYVDGEIKQDIETKPKREWRMTKEQLKQISINPDLNAEQQRQLKSLLSQYADIFSWELFDIGHYSNGALAIDTGDAKPVAIPPYKKSIMEREYIKQRVKELLEAGVIRQSKSPWQAPILLVKKKDSPDLRMCVDYRGLNKVTKVEKWPMPQVSDIFEILHKAKWFSRLDIQHGYYQFDIKDSDIEKTAFSTTDAKYEFTRVPFGLGSAPGFFCHQMSQIFGNLVYGKAFIFMDDIAPYAATFEEHLAILKQIFMRLRRVNITLKPSKCSFMMNEIKLLGHVISHGTVKPDPEKIRAVKEMPRPRDVKQVRAFVGLVSYYRRFIPNLAAIGKPLTDLTKHDAEFNWTPECQKAFEELKLRLTSEPVLRQFDPRLPIEIHTDASNYAIGAILLQREKNIPRVVAFASRVLSSAETNYSTTEKECLGFVWALSKFRQYVHSLPIKCVVDHHALCQLRSVKNPSNSRIARWNLAVQDYDLEIVYQKGSKHQPDCLSRLVPCPKFAENPNPFKFDETELQEVYSVLIGTDYRSQLKQAQHNDPHLAQIIHYIKSTFPQTNYKQYVYANELLYFRSTPKHFRLVIPKVLVAEILRAFHDSKFAGHLGITKTIDRIERRFFWSTLVTDVHKYVRSCGKCNQRKPMNSAPVGHMKPSEIYQPFDKISVDLIGPLPKSYPGGYQYIAVCVDTHTKFVIAAPLPAATSNHLSKFLTKHIFFVHGIPKEINLDNASINRSKLIQNLILSIGSHPVYTTPYAHRSNPVERVNRSLEEVLSHYIKSNHTDWHQHLPAVVFALNTAVHKSTKFSSFYLVYGRQPNFPLDIAFDIQPSVESPDLQRLLNARKQAQANILKAQDSSKIYFDRSRRDLSFSEGTEVFEEFLQPDIGHAKKLSSRFRGPFRIVRQLTPLTYQIKRVSNGKLRVAHVQRLKPVIERPAFMRKTDTNNSQLYTVPEIEINSPSNELVSIPTNPLVTSVITNLPVSTDATTNIKLTRSGRQIKLPARFKN